MEFKFIPAPKNDARMKATVHKTGMLGFNMAAIKELNITPDTTIMVAINPDDPNDDNLYVIFYPDNKEGAYKMRKAGDYYYAKTKPLMDRLNIDYKKPEQTIIYDIYP
ncbi:MAG: hypothetical protein ACLFQX_13385, partial [Candidatus Kapaibacterium sp.]